MGPLGRPRRTASVTFVPARLAQFVPNSALATHLATEIGMSEDTDNASGVAENLEDAHAATAGDRPLTDEELKRGGLVKVVAHVRKGKTSAARRTDRHREHQKAAGLKQINVIIPDTEPLRAAMKDLARALAEHRVIADDLFDLLGGRDREHDPVRSDIAHLRRILKKGGWRATLIRWLAGASRTR
jgi:hypothetical protein